MQEIHAQLKNLRIAPKKVRMVASLLKNMDVRTAEAHLRHLHQKSASSLLKLLLSCVANAQHNNRVMKNDLYVKLVRVDAGPSLRRQSRTWHGMAHLLLKRTSHVTVVLMEKSGMGARTSSQEAGETFPVAAKKQRGRVKQSATPKVARPVERKRATRSPSAAKTRIFNRKAI